MKKGTKILLITLGVFVGFGILTGVLNKLSDLSGDSVKLEVKDAYVNGEMGRYIKIEDGSYELAVDNNENRSLGISVRIRLENEYPDDPEAAADSFVIVPLTKAQIPLEGIELKAAGQSRERLISLLSGTAGASANVTFMGVPLDTNYAAMKRVIDTAGNIEGGSSTIAAKLVLAVAPVECEDREFAGEVRSAVQAGLLKHRFASRFRVVDTSQIDKIAEQHKFELSDWSSNNKAAEIGRALNANILVTIKAVKKPKPILVGGVEGMDESPVSITVLDINTMEVLGTLNTEFSNLGYSTSGVSGMELNLR